MSKCKHMKCDCPGYVTPTSKWSKGKCNRCLHSQSVHGSTPVTNASFFNKTVAKPPTWKSNNYTSINYNNTKPNKHITRNRTIKSNTTVTPPKVKSHWKTNNYTYNNNGYNNTYNNTNKQKTLDKAYNNYISDKYEKPSNTYDLINYMQYKNITGFTHKDINDFLNKKSKQSQPIKHTINKTNYNNYSNNRTNRSMTTANSYQNNSTNNRLRTRADTNTASYNNDNVREIYQIYYKAKGQKPSTAQQLLQYSKTINRHVKWGDVNKFMKNSQQYLNSLVTVSALQRIQMPQTHIKNTFSIKVVDTDSEYYWIKDLTLNSTIDDICNKLGPRLYKNATMINLYKDNEPLSRWHTLRQAGLEDGDTIALGVHNTSIGMDSFLQRCKNKRQNYQSSSYQYQKRVNRNVQVKGNKYEWKNKKIGKWNNDDILHWIDSFDLDNKWKNKLMEQVKLIECNGKDLKCLSSGVDFGEAFDVSNNKYLCDKMYKEIKQLFGGQKKNNNNYNVGGNGKFKINIFSQDKYITLNQMVTKNIRVREVTQMYKKQSGVPASIDDIHFYCHRKLLPQWKTLAQVNIVDEKHLITVKFGANGASFSVYNEY
eukprot:251956_1